MPTMVVHVREGFDVYIGRPTRPYPMGSCWGNPFRIGRDGDRAEVIAKFRDWVVHSDSMDAQWMRAHLGELRGKRLGCWCKPGRPCHGDTLAELADAGRDVEVNDAPSA